MTRLPRKWREILDNFEFHRERLGLCNAEVVPDAETMRPIFERLAAKWEGRVFPVCPVGQLVKFMRKAKPARSETALCVRKFEQGKFLVVLEEDRGTPQGDVQQIQVEFCSPTRLYDVLDVLLCDLHGAAGPRPLPEGWVTLDLPDGTGKFWEETERAWLESQNLERLIPFPPGLREDRAWRLLCRLVTGAVALFPCSCIRDLARVFQGKVTCQDPAWVASARYKECADAMSRCAMMSQGCPSYQLWMLTGLAPVAPTRFLRTAAYLPCKIPGWVELTRATIRDVVGNPYRPVYPEPVWLSSNDRAVEHLARHIDDHGEYNKLGLLGDALQDAGCDNPAVLDHCREGGVHGPGCWVVDTLLGRMYSRS